MVPFQFATSAEIVQNLKINWSEWSSTSRNQSMVGRSLTSTIKSLTPGKSNTNYPAKHVNKFKMVHPSRIALWWCAKLYTLLRTTTTQWKSKLYVGNSSVVKIYIIRPKSGPVAKNATPRPSGFLARSLVAAAIGYWKLLSRFQSFSKNNTSSFVIC